MNYSNKILSISLLFFLFISLISYQTKKQLVKVKVYKVEENKERYIGITEFSIKRIKTADTWVIKDSSCLRFIENEIKSLKKISIKNSSPSIYMLCELGYSDSSKSILSFGDYNSKIINFNSQFFNLSLSLKNKILACR